MLLAPPAQVLAELRVLQAYREPLVGRSSQILALGLSSRKNMCIHPKARRASARRAPSRRGAEASLRAQVADEGSRENVDAGCRKLTATWVCERAGAVGESGGDASVELCDFFETYERAGADALLPPGVYTVRPPAACLCSCGP